jgi:protein-S-isoprenylcysteine O-methyltransferase Ste14
LRQRFLEEANLAQEAGMKSVAVLYGAVVYAIFFATFLYAVGFVAGAPIPKAIDSGPVVGAGEAVVVDLLLLGLFAVQHSLMAREAFKAWWTRFVPKPVERSTYVLFASLCLILLYWQWRPLPTVVWSVGAPWSAVLWAVSALGWATVLLSTFLINHFDLFGLRQVWAYRQGREAPPPDFKAPLFYKVVRHPIYLGFILAFWATPDMTQGHLLFAAATTAYILIGIQLEERDLLKVFGARYEAYREEAGMLYPKVRRSRSGARLQH